MSTQRPDDLNTLIDQAQETVAHRPGARPDRRSNALPRPLTGALLLGLTAYAIFVISAHLSPPSPQQVAHDLETIVDQAHQSIEKTRADQGELPDALPDASLGSIVQYEREQDRYALSATVMGIRVTLTPDGRRITETGIKE